MIYLIIYIKILFTIVNVDFIKVIFNICFIKKIDKMLFFTINYIHLCFKPLNLYHEIEDYFIQF